MIFVFRYGWSGGDCYILANSQEEAWAKAMDRVGGREEEIQDFREIAK